jgi:SAM-dependent methyltransferase
MYLISDEDVQKAQAEYKTKYPPFIPYHLHKTDGKLKFLLQKLLYLFSTQNGMDTDDYPIVENNKVSRYLKHIPEKSKTLLLGTGTGREVLVAKSMNLDPVGITLGSRNVYFGLNYLGLNSEELKEELNECLPYKPNTFDVIAGFQVFEHTMVPLLFLLEMSRVLKEGGELILEWPPANDAHTGGANPHHQICFTPGQAKGLFEKAGFKNIKLFYEDMTPIPTEEYWHGDQKKMLVISGTKQAFSEVQQYIKYIWQMQE